MTNTTTIYVDPHVFSHLADWANLIYIVLAIIAIVVSLVIAFRK